MPRDFWYGERELCAVQTGLLVSRRCPPSPLVVILQDDSPFRSDDYSLKCSLEDRICNLDEIKMKRRCCWGILTARLHVKVHLLVWPGYGKTDQFFVEEEKEKSFNRHWLDFGWRIHANAFHIVKHKNLKWDTSVVPSVQHFQVCVLDLGKIPDP